MSGGQVKQTEIILGPLRRSDLNSKLSCRAINHPNANPLEATVQIDMNCEYLSPPFLLSGPHTRPLVTRSVVVVCGSLRRGQTESQAGPTQYVSIFIRLPSGIALRRRSVRPAVRRESSGLACLWDQPAAVLSWANEYAASFQCPSSDPNAAFIDLAR